MVHFNIIFEHVISMLKKGLSPSLIYHGIDHTIDVVTESVIIAREEGITDEETLTELQIAALYHDTGFLYAYKGHEEKSIELARKELPLFKVPQKEIDAICTLINATKIPQTPKNILQQIICDADLDYLGRDDYFITSEKLHKEFMKYGIVQNEEEWKLSRIRFLQSHTYFTSSARRKRDHSKHEHLQHLILEEKAE